MGSPPLAALAIKPPEQPDILGNVQKITALKSLLQNQQLQQLQMQGMQQQQEAFQRKQQEGEAIRRAYVNNQGDLDKTIAEASKNPLVSPDTLFALQDHATKAKTDLYSRDEAANKLRAQQVDNLRGLFKPVYDMPADAPADQVEALYQQQRAVIAKNPQAYGLTDPSQVPPKFPGKQAGEVMMAGMQGEAAQLAQHSKQQENLLHEAQTRKTNAEAVIAEEGGPRVDRQEFMDYMKNVKGATPAGYPAWKAARIAEAEEPSKTRTAVATEVAKAQALAPTVDEVTKTTSSGRSYADTSQLTGPTAAIVKKQAYAAGIPIADKDTANLLTDIDTARANQKYMMDTIGKKLATSPAGRLWSGPANTIEKLAQTDPDLAAMGTYRTAAIQTLRAVAGSRGLRINKAEIETAQENDIPKLTDTLQAAQAKLKNLATFLDNTEKAHLVQNRQTETTGKPKQGGGKYWEQFPVH